MTELRRLQARMLDWLLEGEGAIADEVADGGRLSVATRLGIYGNAYQERLLEALTESYPALHALLGDDRFRELGMAYVRARPSAHFSIRWFGHRLGEMLARDPVYRDTPVLAEMAAFEWALRDAFDAAGEPALGRADLQAVPSEAWPGLVLRLHPSVRRLDLEWNVPRLWTAIDRGEPPIPPERAPWPIGWLVWRQGFRTLFRSLEVDEAWALDAAGRGEPFEALCGGLTEWVDEIHAPNRAAALLAGWLDEGLVAGFVLP